ncbi:hypothetical protein HNO88_000307 [Novosphingobium chloroacetimidivorans]|uniref:Uncharacterized protein n=2 Tax=Novosphingobium chloroacetimidivorans TaxID=1428314 RepID=A0A7W7K6V2_9SPHN|nr:hypothetical protein [Novosphingobium chloroacetimidivorans]
MKTRQLPRSDIGAFIGSPRGVRAFEDLQGDTAQIYKAVNETSFLTIEDSPSTGSERKFTPVAGDLVGEDGGANTTYSLSLAEVGITAGGYGDEASTIKVTVDAKGRVTNVDVFDLNTDNVTEGLTNLFYTNARARAALSDGVGIDYDADTGEISLDTDDDRNVDHSSVSIIAGAGLTGGGTIEESRTIDLEAIGAPGTYANPTSITIDQYGRVTAIA